MLLAAAVFCPCFYSAVIVRENAGLLLLCAASERGKNIAVFCGQPVSSGHLLFLQAAHT